MTYSDIYAFAIALGYAPERLPPHYKGNLTNVASGYYRPLEEGKEQNAYDFVRRNLGAFVQFVAWRYIAQTMINRSDADEQAPAVCTSLASAGSESQNIDWIGDMTVERPAVVHLPMSGGRFKSINLQLPDGMVGKLAESYAPQKEVAQAYLSAVRAFKNAAQSELMRMERQRRSAEEDAFEKAAQTISALTDGTGWRLEGQYLVYDQPIIATRLMFRNKIFNLPEQYQGKFTIYEIKVRVGTRILNPVAKGHHPHVQGDYPNDFTTMCVGELEATEIANIAKIPEMMETLYYHSMWENHASHMINYLVDIGFRRQFADEYPGLSEYIMKAYEKGEWDEEVFHT
ncbi:MAG: hypothetical protein WCR85_00005 [Sphaerochaeta sp.]